MNTRFDNGDCIMRWPTYKSLKRTRSRGVTTLMILSAPGWSSWRRKSMGATIRMAQIREFRRSSFPICRSPSCSTQAFGRRNSISSIKKPAGLLVLSGVQVVEQGLSVLRRRRGVLQERASRGLESRDVFLHFRPSRYLAIHETRESEGEASPIAKLAPRL